MRKNWKFADMKNNKQCKFEKEGRVGSKLSQPNTHQEEERKKKEESVYVIVKIRTFHSVKVNLKFMSSIFVYLLIYDSCMDYEY